MREATLGSSLRDSYVLGLSLRSSSSAMRDHSSATLSQRAAVDLLASRSARALQAAASVRNSAILGSCIATPSLPRERLTYCKGFSARFGITKQSRRRPAPMWIFEFSAKWLKAWWARQDLNPEPDGYEPSALTIELQAPTPTQWLQQFSFLCYRPDDVDPESHSPGRRRPAH